MIIETIILRINLRSSLLIKEPSLVLVAGDTSALYLSFKPTLKNVKKDGFRVISNYVI